LFLHQADLDSIIVEESNVISQVDGELNNAVNQLGSKEKVEEVYGKSFSKLREERREIDRNIMTVNRVKAKLVGSIAVTPSEVRQYFNNLPVDSIPMTPAESEVEIITIEPKYSPSDLEAIKDRLRSFTERVNKGENFSTLALMYSDDRESAKLGGELGFMGKGQLVPEFANVAFSLTDPKKVSKIVEAGRSYKYPSHFVKT